MFINDLIDTIPPEAHPTLFADDLKIYSDLPVCLTSTSPGSAYCPLLQLSLNHISYWSKLWQLSIASNKCSCLSISNKKTESPRLYLIDSLPIPQVESCCDLGILIDDKLFFLCPYFSLLLRKLLLNLSSYVVVSNLKIHHSYHQHSPLMFAQF